MTGDAAARRTLGVGMVGYAFMGRAHSQAWRTVGHFFELPFAPRMAGKHVLCEKPLANTVDEARAMAAAAARAAAAGSTWTEVAA